MNNTTTHTHGGKQIDLLNPDPNEINIYDIAYALSRMCRFNGHNELLNVALHSICVYREIARQDEHKTNYQLQLYALLHDAHEAYMGDITRPVKEAIKALSNDDVVARIEKNVDLAIYHHCGLDLLPTAFAKSEIKKADNYIMVSEAYYGFRQQVQPSWVKSMLGNRKPTIDVIGISTTSKEMPKSLFLATFHYLQAKLKEQKNAT